MSATTETAAKPEKPAFPPPPATPTQEAPAGIRFDFNHGARVLLPEGEWQVEISDVESRNILFKAPVRNGLVTSTKKYFVPFKITIWLDSKKVLEHSFDLRGRKVLVSLPVGTIGDTMAWFSYVVRFQQKHGCHTTCAMSELLIPLFKESNPHIQLTTHETVSTDEFYASYNIGLFFKDHALVFQPTDFRFVGLHRTAGYILGVSPDEERPAVHISDDTRPMQERYICIAVQASTLAKKWNNHMGWYEVVDFAKKRGYRVVCIDKDRTHGSGVAWTSIPHNAEDETGNKSLSERARWLKHADAFVGVSSGLSWIAWSVGCPTVLISGFTHPTNEFHTEGRVINWHACNSCWNDSSYTFDHKDYFWCPRHKGTERQYECSRLITSGQVMDALERVLPPLN